MEALAGTGFVPMLATHPAAFPVPSAVAPPLPLPLTPPPPVAGGASVRATGKVTTPSFQTVPAPPVRAPLQLALPQLDTTNFLQQELAGRDMKQALAKPAYDPLTFGDSSMGLAGAMLDRNIQVDNYTKALAMRQAQNDVLTADFETRKSGLNTAANLDQMSDTRNSQKLNQQGKQIENATAEENYKNIRTPEEKAQLDAHYASLMQKNRLDYGMKINEMAKSQVAEDKGRLAAEKNDLAIIKSALTMFPPDALPQLFNVDGTVNMSGLNTFKGTVANPALFDAAIAAGERIRKQYGYNPMQGGSVGVDSLLEATQPAAATQPGAVVSFDDFMNN